MLTSIGIIAVLLILSAFFSGSETALTAASRAQMHQAELDGDHRAALVNKLRDDKERLIGAILLGNNLVNILASALATSALIALVGKAGVAYATIAMTLLVLVFSEIMPKTYAIRNANAMAVAVAPIIRIIVAVFGPITLAINYLIGGLFRIAGIATTTETDAAEAELRGAIELHEGDEDAIRHERAMLRGILDLDEVPVYEIMMHRKNVVTVDASLPAAEIVEQVLQSPYTRLPLWKDDPDNIVGVIHAKALLREIRGREGDIGTLDITTIANAPWFIPEQTSLLDQLHAFRERREHFALVVDEYGSLMGVVTLEDILEEIVGDIDDEHDIAVDGVLTQADGSFEVDGTATIRDLNREYDWGLPGDEASTVAGLLLHESRRIPEVGQCFMFHGFRFDVLDRQRHQITRIRVTPPADGEPLMPDGQGPCG